MIKRFFIILSLFLFLFSLVFCYADDLYTYDDRAVYFNYSARTATITSVGYNGTASRIARGNTCMFDIYGSSVDIYCVKYTNSGRARIYVDGSPVGYTPSGVTSSFTPALAYSVSGLSKGKHTISIEAWDSTVTSPSATSVTAYFFLDAVVVDRSLDIDDIYSSFYLVILFLILLFVILFNLIQYVLWRLSKRD